MLNNNNGGRVLSRMGARDLTPEESEQIGGSNGVTPSLLSVLRTGTPVSPDYSLDE